MNNLPFQQKFISLLAKSIIVITSLAFLACGSSKNKTAIECIGEKVTERNFIRRLEGSMQIGAESVYLTMALKRDNEKLVGAYFFNNVGTNIMIEGTISDDCPFLINEFPNGPPLSTGEFFGHAYLNKGALELKGEWKNPEGDKIRSFHLVEKPLPYSLQNSVITKGAESEGLKFAVALNYPEVKNANSPKLKEGFNSFTDSLKSLANNFESDFTKAKPELLKQKFPAFALGGSYNIAYMSDNVFSMYYILSDNRGAADRSTRISSFVFDVVENKKVELKDLFRGDVKYLDTLSMLCKIELSRSFGAEASHEMFRKGAAPLASNFNVFWLSRNAMIVQFANNQAGPGMPWVYILYDKLVNVKQPDGIIDRIIKEGKS